MATIMRFGFETVLVHKCEEGETGYWAEVIGMPGCVSQGVTLVELQAHIQEAIRAVYDSSMSNSPAAASQSFSWPATETSTA